SCQPQLCHHFLTHSRLSHHYPVTLFYDAPPTTDIYTLSLHDALPISRRALRAPPTRRWPGRRPPEVGCGRTSTSYLRRTPSWPRSEEHTSELQSRSDLVCRLLLEKKKNSTGAQGISKRSLGVGWVLRS